MRFTLTVEMDNEAFVYQEGKETARILRKLADKLEAQLREGDSGRLMDFNGNRVGEWRVEES